ncbi:hypothetical protein GEMRC1_006881 [Eukaryota sp. GEM-RC1]
MKMLASRSKLKKKSTPASLQSASVPSHPLGPVRKPPSKSTVKEATPSKTSKKPEAKTLAKTIPPEDDYDVVYEYEYDYDYDSESES